ncbi:MAG: bifunctional metallophosphatase/5'-nucleotidase [Deltaproteobacteria bacterium]|nr:bifunctional metallophosphatase/5'-nucleotidase [Deltaproteobacteria bacterium]
MEGGADDVARAAPRTTPLSAALCGVLGLLAGGSLLATGACILQAEQQELAGQDIRLTVLHTSDWHSRLIPYVIDPPVPVQSLGLMPENAPFGGASRMMTLLKQERARAERVVHIDSGDCFQGAPIFNEFYGEPEMRALSLAGMDAMVIGNHEFDAGADNFVTQVTRWAGFPFLAANYVFRSPRQVTNNGLGDAAQPITVLNIQGLKILIIGLGNISSLTSIGQEGNSLQIDPLEPNEVVQKYINLYAHSVDLVFVLSHMGLEIDQALLEGYDRVYDLAEASPDTLRREWNCDVIEDASTAICHVPPVRGIDIVFGGHLHVVLNPPRLVKDVDGRDVPIVHSGAFTQFIGRLDVVTRDHDRFEPPRDAYFGREILTHRYRPIPVDNRAEPDWEMERLLAPYKEQLARRVDLGRPVAWATTNIIRNNPNGGDSPLGNLVSAAIGYKPRVRTDFQVTNSLGIRDNLNTGTITREELYNVFPFENTVTTMFLSGREVQELVDFIAIRSKSRGCRTQAQVNNISFLMRCDCALNATGCCDPATAGQEVYACADDVRIGGQPINPNGAYQLGTNDYIAAGGSGFQVLRRNTTQQNSFIPLRVVVEEYLQTFPPCDDETVQLSIDAARASNQDEGERLQREWDYIRQFGTPKCVDPTNMADGRIRRRLGG